MSAESATVRYIENTYAFTGSNFPSCTVTEFVTRIRNGEKLYEVTPDIVRLYFDVDIKTKTTIQKAIAKTIVQKAEEFIRLTLDEKFENQYSIVVGTSHGQAYDTKKNPINKYSVRYWIPEIKTDKKTLQNLIKKMNEYFLQTRNEYDHLFEYCGDLFESGEVDKKGNPIFHSLFDDAP